MPVAVAGSAGLELAMVLVEVEQRSLRPSSAWADTNWVGSGAGQSWAPQAWKFSKAWKKFKEKQLR